MTSTTRNLADSKQILIPPPEQFGIHGYIPRTVAFSAQRAHQYLERIECAARLLGKHPSREALRLKGHTLIRAAYECATSPHILDVVRAVLGADVVLMSSQLWPKMGGDGRYVGWHQDSAFAQISPAKGVTCWLALTDATLEHGCLHCIPGTHKLGVLRHTKSTDPLNIGGCDIEEGLPKEVRALDLTAGSFSIHDLNLVHGSPPAQAGLRRVGMSLTFVPANCRPLAESFSGIVVSGADNENYWVKDKIPESEVDFANLDTALRHNIGVRAAAFKLT